MKRNDTLGGENIRLLTKAETCRELRLSLSTLNRRIAAGEVPVKREPRGRRPRVYVMLDDGLPGALDTPQSEVAVARERIRDLAAQVELLQGLLEQERQRNAELAEELKAAPGSTAQERRRRWWRFWQSRW